MGWRHRGLYTVATRHARGRLTRDEVVAGTWAHLTRRDAPEADLPGDGLLVVHGFGPASSHAHAPWDAFWPRTWLTGFDALPTGFDALLGCFDHAHRPPAQLVAWMREFGSRTGQPIALYQYDMSGGLDLETALICDPDGDTLTVREDRGTRQWRSGAWGRARHDPLQTMLRALRARPAGSSMPAPTPRRWSGAGPPCTPRATPAGPTWWNCCWTPSPACWTPSRTAA
jgi:hypothetical protein